MLISVGAIYVISFFVNRYPKEVFKVYGILVWHYETGIRKVKGLPSNGRGKDFFTGEFSGARHSAPQCLDKIRIRNFRSNR